MTRPWDAKQKKFKTQLTVDEVRQTVSFFGTSRGEGGWRVAIVDCVDDMNVNASNALLKVLEEPPADTLFFVLAHSPAKVMATIRSRCQHVPMRALADDEVLEVLSRFRALENLDVDDQSLLAQLSKGSVRTGLILAQGEGLELYKRFNAVCSDLANPDWTEVHILAESTLLKGREERFRLLLDFANQHMENLATGKITQNGSSDVSTLARWAAVWEKTQNSNRIAESYNLDKKQVILNLFQAMSEAARH